MTFQATSISIGFCSQHITSFLYLLLLLLLTQVHFRLTATTEQAKKEHVKKQKFCSNPLFPKAALRFLSHMQYLYGLSLFQAHKITMHSE